MVLAPELSLRGAKRRGNLAVPGWITGKPRRKRNCLPEIAPQGHFLALRAQGATSAFGLPAMTNLGALRRRMCAAVIVNLQGAQGAPLQAALKIRAKNTPIRSDGGVFCTDFQSCLQRRSLSALQVDNDCGTHSAAQGSQVCHCGEAKGRRGALSAKREEVPLGCNLGKAVTFSPGLSCYPPRYCEIAASLRSSQ